MKTVCFGAMIAIDVLAQVHTISLQIKTRVLACVVHSMSKCAYCALGMSCTCNDHGELAE